jgi:hypothetical protein
MMNPLLYSKLPEPDSIRLVRLHAGEQDTCIRLSLELARISEAPLYDALSYTWGDAGSDRIVSINCQEVSIRTNLYAALKAIHGTKGSLTLWVDALCISQDDLEEKSHQVQMIGRIFRGARQVIAWLGPSTADIRLLFFAASKLPTDTYIPEETLDDIRRAHDFRSQLPRRELSVLRSALLTIHARDYWTRTWIVQECILAQRVMFLCGIHEASWHQLYSIHAFVRETAQVLPNRGTSGRQLRPCIYSAGYTDGPGSLEITFFDQLAGQKAFLNGRRRNIGQTLRYFGHNTQCLDPRDKVFAFMELILEGEENHPARIIVDYSIPTTLLYFRTIHGLLSNERSEFGQIRDIDTIRQLLGLESAAVKEAITARIDVTALLSPVTFITGGDGDGNGLNPYPVRGEPGRRYNYYEVLAADFELLATGRRGKQARRIIAMG